MACPACGFEPSTVTPPDAIAALRSYPRRSRELIPPDEEPDPVVLDSAGRAATIIDALGADLEAILVTDDASLTTDASLATSAAPSGDRLTALDRLTAATTRVADLAGRQPAAAWSRTGLRPSGPVTAGDLLREAVHAGIHNLRIAQKF